MRVVLASTSPRRKDLLEILQFSFSVIAPDCDEEAKGGHTVEELVQHLAGQKAQSVAHRFPEALVIGGDTLIEINGEILGKPGNEHEAATMLRQLSGRMHRVHSGIAVVCHTRNRVRAEGDTVEVHMKTLSESDIQAYVSTGECLGKAGSYCIQEEGANLIEKIAGDYPTVVGLPLMKVYEILKEEGVNFPVNIENIYREKPYPNWKKFS